MREKFKQQFEESSFKFTNIHANNKHHNQRRRPTFDCQAATRAARRPAGAASDQEQRNFRKRACESERMENNNKMDLSFSGAGFMGVYYFGVVDCWNKYIPRERVNRVAGASAGSLIAAYYLMDLPLGNCLREIIGLTEDIRRRPLGVFDRSNQIVDVLPKLLDKIFPDDAHKRVSGRLHICMTRLKDMKKIIVNEFETKKDLIDALNCSCFIPVWSGGHVSTYKNVKHIDGGFSDNLPVFDEHTIRICCFSGATDISPYDRAKMELLSGTVLNTPLYWNFANFGRFRRALFPPPASFLLTQLENGFHDTKDFILSNDLIQCNSCYSKTSLKDQLIYQRATPTITPSVSPAISRAGSFRTLNGTAATPLDENNNNNNSSSSNLNFGGKIRSSSALSKKDESFGALVSEKLLRSCSPVESNCHSGGAQSPATPHYDRNHNQTPIILINDDERSQTDSSSAESDGSDGMQRNSELCKVGPIESRGRKSAVPKEQQVPTSAGARRRSTLHQVDEPRQSLLVMRDRFTLAPSPLPSCPPSPNLNRHCTECIRLRQEARLDALEDEIRRVAEQFLDPEPQPIRVGGLKDKLASPLRWLKTLGTKSSYKFQIDPAINATTDHCRF